MCKPISTHTPQLGFRLLLAYLPKLHYSLRGIRLQISYAFLIHTLGREANCLFQTMYPEKHSFSLSLFTTHYLCDSTWGKEKVASLLVHSLLLYAECHRYKKSINKKAPDLTCNYKYSLYKIYSQVKCA